MIMKCLQCGNEFDAARSTAKYCSDKCRKLAFQSDGKVSVPEVSVPKHIKVIDRSRRKPGNEGYYGAFIEVNGQWTPRAKAHAND